MRSILFPYTTLFRSTAAQPDAVRGAAGEVEDEVDVWHGLSPLGGRMSTRGRFVWLCAGCGERAVVGVEDGGEVEAALGEAPQLLRVPSGEAGLAGRGEFLALLTLPLLLGAGTGD